MMSVPDAADYFGYGRNKLPGHRSDVTTCPCLGCRKIRGIQYAFRAHAEAIRFIFHLRWWRWIAERRRKHWPAINEADPEKLEQEDYDEA